MSDSRQRFAAWLNADCNAHFVKYEAAGMAIVPPYRPSPEEIWQAAEKATAARCAEIAEKLAATYHAAYKSSYHQHDDGMCDGAGEVETAIRAAFPEAFK